VLTQIKNQQKVTQGEVSGLRRRRGLDGDDPPQRESTASTSYA
jgi:hypothetical protein